jgi:hypothetical protein
MNEERCMIHRIDGHFKRCGSRDIAVTIYYKGRMIPLCHRCWLKVARSRREWGEKKTKRRKKK